MKNFKLFIPYLLIPGTLLIYSCRENAPEPQSLIKNKKSHETYDLPVSNAVGFFTGRDSLQGISFMAKVTGSYQTDNLSLSPKLILEGNGKATHLSFVKVYRSHNILSESLIENGEIRYVGAQGYELSGIYEGSRGPTNNDGSFNFETREEITEGTGKFNGVVGIINTKGVIYPDETFSYRSDGWLSNIKSNKQKNR